MRRVLRLGVIVALLELSAIAPISAEEDSRSYVFMSTTKDVFRVGVDGSDLTTITPPSADRTIRAAYLSPDASSLAIVDPRRVLVGRVDDGDYRRALETSDDRTLGVYWSPDSSRLIVHLRAPEEVDRPDRLVLIPAAAGEPVTLLTADDLGADYLGGGSGWGWSPDGTTFVLFAKTEGWKVRVDGGPLDRWAFLEQYWPSPAGGVAFATENAGDVDRLVLLDAGLTVSRTLRYVENFGISQGTWAHNGRRLALLRAGRQFGGPRTVWLFDRKGTLVDVAGPFPVVPDLLGDASRLAVSPDGNIIAFAMADSLALRHDGIYVHDVRLDRTCQVTSDASVAFRDSFGIRPSFSPDGRYLIVNGYATLATRDITTPGRRWNHLDNSTRPDPDLLGTASTSPDVIAGEPCSHTIAPRTLYLTLNRVGARLRVSARVKAYGVWQCREFVPLRFQTRKDGTWVTMQTRRTNDAGRATGYLPAGAHARVVAPTVYRGKYQCLAAAA